jgi:hypothetical protein
MAGFASCRPVENRRRGYQPPEMRAMFVGWLLLIGTGLVYFTVIGLTHH